MTLTPPNWSRGGPFSVWPERRLPYTAKIVLLVEVPKAGSATPIDLLGALKTPERTPRRTRFAHAHEWRRATRPHPARSRGRCDMRPSSTLTYRRRRFAKAHVSQWWNRSRKAGGPMQTGKIWVALVLLLALAGCDRSPDRRSTAEEEQALTNVDLVLHNGRIFTSNPGLPWAEALAIDEGRFVYVGNGQGTAAFNAAAVIDLEGRFVMPGLVDAHAHPGYVDLEQFGYVEGATPAALLASVKHYADAHPDQEWLRLCCWPTEMFVEGERGPRKEVLDAVLPDRLVWFESETAHDFWLNSAALNHLGIDATTPDPRPGLAMYARSASGEPTGWVKEGAGVQHFAREFALVEAADVRRHRDGVVETLETLSRHGVTALFDAGNKGFGDHTYSLLAELEREGRLPLRYFGTYQIFVPERAQEAISELQRYQRMYGGERLQFRSVKLFMDGITANRSASYSEPYEGGDEAVATMLSSNALEDLLLALHDAKLDLHVHAIGDRAVSTVLDAVEAARKEIGTSFYPRVTVAHLALVKPSDIARIARLGVIANFSPWWFGAEADDAALELLGPSRFQRMYQARSVMSSGARVTFSSDEWWGGDMLSTYVSPYLGMQVGHTRQYPRSWRQAGDEHVREPADERLPLDRLLDGYTRHGAYQLRLEEQIGSVEPGKSADFVVLERNLFDLPPETIADVRPVAVVMEGEVIRGALAPPAH